MGAAEERQALERAVSAARKIVFGERQSIRQPQRPSPQPQPEVRPGEQAQT